MANMGGQCRSTGVALKNNLYDMVCVFESSAETWNKHITCFYLELCLSLWSSPVFFYHVPYNGFIMRFLEYVTDAIFHI